MSRKAWLGMSLAALATAAAATYWFAWRWPQGDIQASLTAQRPTAGEATARLVIKTNQPYSVAMRRGVTMDLRSRDISIDSAKPVDLGGHLGFEVSGRPVAPIAECPITVEFARSGKTVGSTPLTINPEAWPFPQGPVEANAVEVIPLGTRSDLTIVTNQLYAIASGFDPGLEMSADFGESHGAVPVDVEGKLGFKVDFQAHSPNASEAASATLMAAGSPVASFETPIGVPMPQFFRDREVTFAEMVESPPTDIYGSDITIWRSQDVDSGDRWVVAGHAASSVCRRVSSSVWRLAMESNLDAPDFFVGAGFACLEPRLGPDDIWERFMAFEAAWPEAAELIAPEMPGLDAFRKRALVVFGAKVIRETLADAAMPSISATDDEIRAFESLMQEATGGGVLDAGVGGTLLAQARRPERAAELRIAGRAAEPSPLTAYLRDLPNEERAAFRADLTDLYDLMTAGAEIGLDIARASDDTGLVHLPDPSGATVTHAVAREVEQSLAAFAADDSVEYPVSYVSEVAGGHLGVAALPYYDLQGSPIRLQIPADTLHAETGERIEQFLADSLSRELSTSARRAAARWRDSATGAGLSLRHWVSRADGSLSDWLHESEEITFEILDPHGRPTGATRSEWIRRSIHISRRFDFIADALTSAASFEALARSLEARSDDPRLVRVVSVTCTDSFLRGWPLSFVDASLETRFQTWIDERRDQTWEALFQEGREQGLDLTALIDESTIFLSRREGEQLIVEPRAVVDLATYALHRDRAAGLFAYRSPWTGRVLEGLKPHELNALGLTAGAGEDDLAAAATRQVVALLGDDSLTPADPVNPEPAIVAEIEDRIALAFALAPEAASRALVLAIMDDLPEEEAATAIELRQARLLVQAEEGNDFAWFEIENLIERGDWKFPEQYLARAGNIRASDPGLALRLTNEAREIDKDFVARFEAGEKEVWSPVLERAIQALRFEGIAFTLSMVRELSGVMADLESSEATLSDIAEALDDVAERISSHNAGVKLSGDVADGAPDELRALAKQIRNTAPQTDMLDRYLWKAELEEVVDAAAIAAVDELEAVGTLSRTTLVHYVELTWATGRYAAAIDLLRDFASNLLDDAPDAEATARRARLEAVIDVARPRMVKGLVYTGRQHVITDLFSRKVTDFALTPTSTDQVVPRLRVMPAERPDQALDDLRTFTGDLTGRKLVDLGGGQQATVTWDASSFSSARVIGVRSARDGESVWKLRPIADPRARAEADAAIYLTGHLRRKGLPLPAQLRAPGSIDVVAQEGGTIITRERLARGVPLDSLRKPGKAIESDVLDAYADLAFRIAHDGADADSARLSRASVLNYKTMRTRVLERNNLAREQAALFDLGESNRAALESAEGSSLADFHDRVEAFAAAAWPGRRPLAKHGIGLVHDAHLGNYYYDAVAPQGKRLTAIDFGSDYIGSVGHTFAFIIRERRPVDGWTLESFRQAVDAEFVRHAETFGEPLVGEAKLEALRAMAFQPYKFISSDSRSFLRRLGRELGLDEQLSPAELRTALAEPNARARLDAVLADPVIKEKYIRELQQLEFTLRILRNETPDAAERAAIDALLETIRESLRTGYRLATSGSDTGRPRC